MVRHGSSNKTTEASDLVNFHFSSSPPSQRTIPPARTRSNRSSQYRKSDRTSARRKASSSMFYLHSSADHAFSISRACRSKGYSFSGQDEAVSWESVKTVKCLVPTSHEESCPVCLDTFTAPRITKCGHCFCLSCLLRHVHTQSETNTSQAVKCPCCSIPLHLVDLRLVVFDSIQPVALQEKMTLVKLHRTKSCPAPYLPRRHAYRHSSPHAAPTTTDQDAPYSRFLYVDPDVYQSQLLANQVELESNVAQLQKQTKQHSSVAMELIFVQMALENVRTEQQQAIAESQQERELMEQYRQPTAGIYQPFSEQVFYQEILPPVKPTSQETPSDDANKESITKTRPNRAESMDSTDSTRKRGGRKKERRLPNPPATMYLDDDSTHFYQSIDGQLCFLSRFNMSCLTTEFSSTPPESDSDETAAQLRKRRPLPDVIEGPVLEKESVHLSPDVRKRMPFLSHLPLYTDVVFVELDLNRLLSDATKTKFKAEMEKRRKRRKSKATAEKRADRVAKEKEQARITELKSRIQRIDPNDEFFQMPAAALTDQDFPTVFTTEDAPSTATQQQPSLPSTQQPYSPSLSFSSVCFRAANPTAVTDEAFPSLASSPPVRSSGGWSNPPGWHGRARAKSVEEEPTSPPQSKGKKSKGKKIHLFSTGGHRGSG